MLKAFFRYFLQSTVLCFGWVFCYPVLAQESSSENPQKGEEFGKMVAKEWTFGFNLNTSGGGMAFEWGKFKNITHKTGFEIAFDYNRHPKEVLGKNPGFFDANLYAYGKLNTLFFLKFGFNYEKTIHQKPYWGGVRIRFRLASGATAGIAVPTFLRVFVLPEGAQFPIYETLRYDPDVIPITDIIGRASFFKGVPHTKLHPGIYLRLGLNFDFSNNPDRAHIIEVGGTLDGVFPGIKQMAFSNTKYIFYGLYVSYRIGNRLGVYEKSFRP